MRKNSSICTIASIEHRLVTDTDTGPLWRVQNAQILAYRLETKFTVESVGKYQSNNILMRLILFVYDSI